MRRKVGDYTVQRELARGGMGAVYVARHDTLGREVALKVLLASRQGDKARARFAAEARLVARLRHPHVVSVHEVGVHEGQPFLVMDLIEGESLEARVDREGPLPHRDAARVLAEIARAVHYAHEQGVLHRDLKPGNVLLSSDGRALLTDFGLAKDLSDERERLTLSGQLLGTPVFMPPEQASASHELIDERSDVYALGMTLYQALSGEVPFLGESLLEVVTAIVNDDPVPPSQHAPGVPPDLDAVVLKCLEKEQRHRYQSARELAEDLERFLADEPVTASRSGLRTRARAILRRGRRSPLAAGLALVLGVGTVALVAHEAVLAPREEARRDLAAELAWQEQALAPGLYGLHPATPLQLDLGDLNRRLAALDHVERVLGPSPDLLAARATLEAHARLAERRRGSARRDAARARRELPHLIVDALASEAKRDLTATWRLLDEAARSAPDAPEVRRVRLALLARHLPQAFLTAAASDDAEASLTTLLAPAALERRYAYLLEDAYGGGDEEHRRDLELLERAVARWRSLPGEVVAAAKVRALEAHAEGWRQGVEGALLRARLGRLERVLRSAPASKGAGGGLLVPALSRALAQRLAGLWEAAGATPSAERLDDLCELERVLGVLDGGRRSSERFQGALAQVMLERTVGGAATSPQLHAFVRHGLPDTSIREVARRNESALPALERRFPASDCARALSYLIVPRDYAALTALARDPDSLGCMCPVYRSELIYMVLEHLPAEAAQVELARSLTRRLQGIELPLIERRWHHEARWHLARVEGRSLQLDDAERAYTDELRAATQGRPQDLELRRTLVEWLEHTAKIVPPAAARPLLEEALGYADRSDEREAIRARLAELGE